MIIQVMVVRRTKRESFSALLQLYLVWDASEGTSRDDGRGILYMCVLPARTREKLKVVGALRARASFPEMLFLIKSKRSNHYSCSTLFSSDDSVGGVFL